MILRNSLYLVLALTLIIVPVSQAAHALTHITDVATINLVQVDNDHDQDETDIDKICPDCLALTTFSDISSILVFSFHVQGTQQQLSFLTLRYIPQDFSSYYHSRAPPLA